VSYRFKYNSRWNSPSLKDKLNTWSSKQVFKLYENKLFQRLKLDSDYFIKGHIEYYKKGGHSTFSNSLSQDHSFTPLRFSFFDIIPLEHSKTFKQNFISLATTYKAAFMMKKAGEVSKIFDDFESHYKSVSWGHFYTNDIRKNKEIDLIDFITFNYIKGPQSTFVVEYDVTPSEKFRNLFKEFLAKDEEVRHVINFNSLKTLFKSKRLTNTLTSSFLGSNYFTRRLIQDLNYQVKSFFGSKLELGLFFKSKNYLYPCISIFEAPKNDFLASKEDFYSALGTGEWDNFITDSNDLIFNLPRIQLSKRPFENLTIIFLNEEEKPKDTLHSTGFLSDQYIKAIAPLFCSLNYSCLCQTFLASQRSQTFKYFNRNKDSLFLKEAIKLKYQITANWLTLSLITNDYKSTIFKNQLHSTGIPKMLRKASHNNDDFKDYLWNYTQNSNNEILNEYEEIRTVFGQISEDNVTRSNMKIQRILFWITIVGVFIAIYSTNTEYFNNWGKYFLRHFFDLEVPSSPS
jgi:hypothetical protein